MRIDRWSKKAPLTPLDVEEGYQVSPGAQFLGTDESFVLVDSLGTDQSRGYIRAESYKRRASSQNYREFITLLAESAQNLKVSDLATSSDTGRDSCSEIKVLKKFPRYQV